MAEDTGTVLVRLGHLNLDGTPAGDVDPSELIPYAQVGVTTTDYCRVAPKSVAV